MDLLTSALEQLVTLVTTSNDRLQQLITASNDIYARLEHVKVDSYVNVRVMDDTGEFPVLSTVAGLQVLAIPGGNFPVVGGPFDVNVTNSPDVNVTNTVAVSGNVGINGTVSVSVANTPTVLARLYAWDMVHAAWTALAGVDCANGVEVYNHDQGIRYTSSQVCALVGATGTVADLPSGDPVFIVPTAQGHGPYSMAVTTIS